MSQHSQRTQLGPSVASIVAGAALVVASAVGTGYVVAGLNLNARSVIGFLTGVGFTALMAFHTLGMMGDRAVALDRARRAAERQERGNVELDAWRNATVGLIDAYLTGYAVDFGGRVVPDYVRSRLADVEPERTREPTVTYAEPDQTQVWRAEPVAPDQAERVAPSPVAPRVEPDSAEAYAASVMDRMVTRYQNEELDPQGRPRHSEPAYEWPTPEPWNAFEPVDRGRAELGQIVVPLPAREPGRALAEDPNWTGYGDSATEVIGRVDPYADEQTQIIPVQS